jgi:membrane fusion protein, multidrug efflux system
MDHEPNPIPSEAIGGSRPDPALAPPEARGRRRWPWLLALVVLALVVVASRGLLGQASKGKGERAGAPRAVPVVGAAARSGDLGVYQSGLGTVTPLSTVTVRSRVDGELVKVAYREGQLVHEGEELAQIDPRPFEVQLHQAEAQLAKDQAALDNAKVDLERYRVLINSDSIPKQQLDTQSTTVDQAEAAIKSDLAQIESARLNLTYSRVTAPTTGIVGLRLVDPGNIVHANDANGLVVITQQQPIAVVFTLPADHLQAVLDKVRRGQQLTVEAWDRDLRTQLATGTLLAVDNQIDQSTGTVRIKALFANADAALYPNQFVNARLLVDTLHHLVLIPTVALERGPQSSYVFVVKEDDSVDLRPVEVQLTEGDVTAIRSGLAAGEMVVTDGLDKLQPGTKVTLAQGNGERKPAR